MYVNPAKERRKKFKPIKYIQSSSFVLILYEIRNVENWFFGSPTAEKKTFFSFRGRLLLIPSFLSVRSVSFFLQNSTWYKGR